MLCFPFWQQRLVLVEGERQPGRVVVCSLGRCAIAVIRWPSCSCYQSRLPRGGRRQPRWSVADGNGRGSPAIGKVAVAEIVRAAAISAAASGGLDGGEAVFSWQLYRSCCSVQTAATTIGQATATDAVSSVIAGGGGQQKHRRLMLTWPDTLWRDWPSLYYLARDQVLWEAEASFGFLVERLYLASLMIVIIVMSEFRVYMQINFGVISGQNSRWNSQLLAGILDRYPLIAFTLVIVIGALILIKIIMESFS